MNRKRWIRLGLGIIALVLLILVLLVVMNFNRKTENFGDPNIPYEKEEPINFQNNSSLTEKEIRDLVEEKRTELKDFFQNAQFYNVSDVLDGYQEEDNEEYLVITESFLTSLEKSLTEDTYLKIKDAFQEVTPASDVLIEEKIYLGERDFFDDIYTNSAIAMIDVNVENLILRNATNTRIEAYEKIELCEEPSTEICQREDYFVLNLVKENDEWKIEEFKEYAER